MFGAAGVVACIYNAVDYCVAIGIDNGIFYWLDSDNHASLSRHAEADGSDAAVEVKDGFAALETGVFPDLGVELAHLLRVDLVKSRCGNFELHAVVRYVGNRIGACHNLVSGSGFADVFCLIHLDNHAL